jgi:hypothetical protein
MKINFSRKIAGVFCFALLFLLFWWFTKVFLSAPDQIGPTSTARHEIVEMSAILKEIEHQIASNKVLIYSKTYCRYSQRAKNAVANLGVSFKAIELDVREFSNLFSRCVFPFVIYFQG